MGSMAQVKFLLQKASTGWKWYLRLLEKHPLRAQMLNTGVLMGAGDVISQICVEHRKPWKDYDKYRTLRFIGVGLFVLGPPMHYWYTALDRFFIKTTLVTSLKKMFCDQAFFLPLYCVVFIASMGILRGEERSEVVEKLHRDLRPIVWTSWQIWVPVQVANFQFVPLRHRILVINLVGLVWNTYVSWKAEREGPEGHSVSLWREAHVSIDHWDSHEITHDLSTPFH